MSKQSLFKFQENLLKTMETRFKSSWNITLILRTLKLKESKETGKSQLSMWVKSMSSVNWIINKVLEIQLLLKILPANLTRKLILLQKHLHQNKHQWPQEEPQLHQIEPSLKTKPHKLHWNQLLKLLQEPLEDNQQIKSE